MTLKIKKTPECQKIQVQNRQKRIKINRDSVARFCFALLQSLDLQDRSVSVAFISLRMMKTLNMQYRNKNYATDVLSFSYDEEVVEGVPFLGEIIIAPEVALSQAMRYGVHPESELRKLLVHGTLHLIDYDHETDTGQMNRIQHQLMRRRFFTDLPLLIESKENR
jgi:probable rRNA maturation factor